MIKKTRKNLAKQENGKSKVNTFVFSKSYCRKKEKLLKIMFGDEKSRKNGIYHDDKDSIL